MFNTARGWPVGRNSYRVFGFFAGGEGYPIWNIGYEISGYQNVNGGEGEIRTPETLLVFTRFRIERLRPLGHLSAGNIF